MVGVIVALSGIAIISGPREVEVDPLETMKTNSKNLNEVYQSDLAAEMLSEVERLPIVDGRTVYIATRPNRGFTKAQYDALDDEQREGLREVEIEPVDYYSTFYGTPLVYARVLDLGSQYVPGFTIAGSKIMDLGYGQLGQLRLWAQMGADTVGVEVDPILTAIYDGCGAVGDVDDDPASSGSVTLVEGAWPNDKSCREEVGGGYDLLVSRNLLKRGYVKPATRNPAFPVPVGWEMSDVEMLDHVFNLLHPGGLVIIESLGPKPDPTKPWSDVSNPWSKQAWIDAGFEVLAHDEDESQYAREMGEALGWDQKMNLETDLFGVYSVYLKPVSNKQKSAEN
jgi:hypothetical protein